MRSPGVWCRASWRRTRRWRLLRRRTRVAWSRRWSRPPGWPPAWRHALRAALAAKDAAESRIARRRDARARGALQALSALCPLAPHGQTMSSVRQPATGHHVAFCCCGDASFPGVLNNMFGGAYQPTGEGRFLIAMIRLLRLRSRALDCPCPGGSNKMAMHVQIERRASRARWRSAWSWRAADAKRWPPAAREECAPPGEEAGRRAGRQPRRCTLSCQRLRRRARQTASRAAAAAGGACPPPALPPLACNCFRFSLHPGPRSCSSQPCRATLEKNWDHRRDLKAGGM